MPVTLNDIAKKANLSKSTVSRILNSRESAFVSGDTRDRVLEAAREMGYTPNHLARALATGQSNVLRLWLSAFGRLHVEVARHMQHLMDAGGFGMLITRADSDAEGYTRPLSLKGFPVDGVLAFDDGPYHISKTVSHVHPGSPPYVSMGLYCSRGCDYVALDGGFAAYTATAHLVDAGCRRVAYAVPDWANNSKDAMRSGYVRAIEDAGYEPEFIVLPNSGDEFDPRSDARQIVKDYVLAYGCPDGIHFSFDEAAIGGYRGLCDLGIRVPDDVCIVGMDGIPDMQYLEVPLSTVSMPIGQMCETAWEFLQNRIKDHSHPMQQVVLKPELVVRQSSIRL